MDKMRTLPGRKEPIALSHYDKNSDIDGKTKDALDGARDFNFIERFGEVPKSIMNFRKVRELMELIDWDSSELGAPESQGGEAKARGGGIAKDLHYSIYNPSAAYFILDYYTKIGATILDPFSGRATRPLVTLLQNKNYIGYDTSLKTIELNKKLISEKFPSKKAPDNFQLIHGDGTALVEFKDVSGIFDAVFTCPPYYGIEKYSGETGDLSYLADEDFEDKIDTMFENIYRLIKTSSYEDMKFYPVIITVGSVRKGNQGIIDMDSVFQEIATRAGFVLHDKIFTVNNTPFAGFTFRRNFCYKYVTKNYETTLVFLKYDK